MTKTTSQQKSKTENSEQNINALCDATITVQAASADGSAKNPTVSIVGYNGGIMEVDYWGPIVIDLAGMSIPTTQNIPILLAHSAYGLEGVLGQTTVITNDGKSVSFTGEIMEVKDSAKDVVAFAKKGYKFQASVGAKPLKVRAIREDETVLVNGQTLKGPFRLMEKTNLKEISIVPLGADGSTTAQIAASHREGEQVMENMKDGTPQATAEEVRAAAVAENTRIEAIKAHCKDNQDVMAKAIADGWTLEKAQTEMIKAENVALKAAAALKATREERPAPAIIIAGKSIKADKDVLLAAACMGAGMQSPDKVFSAENCEKAQDLRIRCLTDLVRASLAMEGKVLDVSSKQDTKEFLRAAFSSASIATIISATANKFVREGFGETELTWREVASVRTVSDFKTYTGVRMVMANLLKELAKNGEIQHGSLSEETRTIKASTKALMIGITREDIINDDLNVLSDIPRRLGFAAQRTFNTDFWAAFVAAIAANFSASAPLSNQTTGPLTLATLKAAEALFLALKDADGNPMGMKATKLLCGTTAFTPARELFISTNVLGGSTKEAASNIYANMFKPLFSAYLPAAPWYLLSNPMAMPVMEACFLNGNQEPVVETADADFNQLGIQMRCYYDYGVAFAENRGAVRSTGV
jgi:hypothetical protein